MIFFEVKHKINRHQSNPGVGSVTITLRYQDHRDQSDPS